MLSTPHVSVLGEPFTPVADTNPAELAAMIQDRYDGLSDLQHVGDEAGMVAGQSTRVGEFEGEAELVEAGLTIDLTLHIAEAVESDDDLLVAIGGYPILRMPQTQERPHIFTLMNAITHPA